MLGVDKGVTVPELCEEGDLLLAKVRRDPFFGPAPPGGVDWHLRLALGGVIPSDTSRAVNGANDALERGGRRPRRELACLSEFSGDSGIVDDDLGLLGGVSASLLGA